MSYKANNNTIIEVETGKQIAVVVPSNCSKKAARMMAAFCAQQMNYEERRKALQVSQPQGKDSHER